MYIPEYNRPIEGSVLREVVQAYPFVTLISKDTKGELYVSHVPVVSSFSGEKLVSIRGHLSNRNPHVENLKINTDVLVLFNGPHIYVTPRWYKSGRDVPTWNYCVVHVRGRLRLESSFEELCTNLRELTSTFESGPDAWTFELPEDLKNPTDLTRAIVAFEILPEKIDGKFKLSQNRPLVDRQSIIQNLLLRADQMSLAIARFMKTSGT